MQSLCFTGRLQSCGLPIQGEDRKSQSSIRVEIGRVVSGNKKDLFKYNSNKTKFKGNIGPILVEDGHLTNRGEVKVEALNAFLPLSLILYVAHARQVMGPRYFLFAFNLFL